jgi:hypothetical protein
MQSILNGSKLVKSKQEGVTQLQLRDWALVIIIFMRNQAVIYISTTTTCPTKGYPSTLSRSSIMVSTSVKQGTATDN